MRSGNPAQAAGIGRRLAALVYECLLVLALVFFAAFAFQGAAGSMLAGWARHFFQVYLFLVVGLYFIACWIRGGQTLPMKTWGLRLISAQGAPVSVHRALARYLLAWLSIVTGGAGFLWAVFDHDRQFLHDRLAGTMIVKA
jgi:uncharacterized RDD family membrane protein YckC